MFRECRGFRQHPRGRGGRLCRRGAPSPRTPFLPRPRSGPAPPPQGPGLPRGSHPGPPSAGKGEERWGEGSVEGAAGALCRRCRGARRGGGGPCALAPGGGRGAAGVPSPRVGGEFGRCLPGPVRARDQFSPLRAEPLPVRGRRAASYPPGVRAVGVPARGTPPLPRRGRGVPGRRPRRRAPAPARLRLPGGPAASSPAGPGRTVPCIPGGDREDVIFKD